MASEKPFTFYRGWAEVEGAKAGAAERGERGVVDRVGVQPSARKAKGNRGSNIDEMFRTGRMGVDAAMSLGPSRPLMKTEDDNGDK